MGGSSEGGRTKDCSESYYPESIRVKKKASLTTGRDSQKGGLDEHLQFSMKRTWGYLHTVDKRRAASYLDWRRRGEGAFPKGIRPDIQDTFFSLHPLQGEGVKVSLKKTPTKRGGFLS